MADTFPLGSVPPLSAWEGEILTFKVDCGFAGATFTKRATPAPTGKMSLDTRTGVFTYAPAAGDRDQIAVVIRARKGPKEAKQRVVITPHPRLPSEFNFIEHVSDPPPDPVSRFYMAYSEQDAGTGRFNHVMEDEAQPGGQPTVMTKKVAVSGVKLVIENSKDKGSLYHRLKDRTNLRELTLCADEVVVRCPLEVPGTDVNIYARTLRFEDQGDEIGRINTSPLPVKTRSTQDVAIDGQKAGDIRLLVLNLEAPGNAHRFIANGSNGQDARHGRKGDDGTSRTPWDGKITVKTWTGLGEQTLDYRRDLRDYKQIKQICIGASVYRNDEHEFDTGSRTWPGDGQEPKVKPGRPGQGGDGGSITTTFKQRMETIAEQKSGEMGAMSRDIPAAKGGEPAIAIWVVAEYKAGVGGIKKLAAQRIDKRSSKTVEAIKAQPSEKPAARKGEIHAPSQGGSSFWLHPMTVRALIAYAKDAMLTGHSKAVLEVLKTYLAAVKVASEAYQEDVVWPTLHTELEGLLQQMDSPYDYFGNPAGWVPMLSFQANHELYKNELGVAIRAMFLAYWVENKQARTEKAAKVREELMARLREETQKALDAYEAARDQAKHLDEEISAIKLRIRQLQTDLENRIADLKRQATDNLKTEHFWRSSAKILGGVMQLIPVGQPVLGAFGKSVTVLSDIDLDDPKGSLGDLTGAWTKVGKEKIAPKFSGLLKGMKSAKEKEEKTDAKKEEFKKELAKEQLKADVAEHMKGQKAAKDSIIGAFSGFAVSEDDVKERLEKVLAECPAYKEIVENVEILNTRKAAFAEDMFAALHTIDTATATVLNNQLALIELRGQLNKTLEGLNLEALQYVRGMGQRARERLLLYQYYLLKSYHYLMLEKLPLIDFRAQKMFDAFAKVLVEQPNGGKNEVNLLEESDDGMLTGKQFEALSAVFENQLREIAKKIIVWYQGNQGRTTGSFLLELMQGEVETLNGPARRVELDLLPRLNIRREDIRITKIEANSVGLAAPLPTKSSNLSLEYLHDGLSRIRRGGRLYLFRTGDYTVEVDAPKGDPDSATTNGDTSDVKERASKTYWSTDISYNPKPKEGDKKLEWSEANIDPEAESLVRYLIGNEGGNKNPLLSFRPSGWTNLAVSRSGDYKGKLDNLTLKVSYVYRRVDDSLSTVLVKVGDGAQPYIRCNALDMNGRGDGQGSFIRTFKKNKGSVTLTAPSQYGWRAFLGWRVEEDSEGVQDGSTTASVSEQLKTDPSLTLNLNKSPDYMVEAVYAPVNYAPVNDKGEEWPACPVNWGFDDWLFVNRTTEALTIHQLTGINTKWDAPAANEPYGSNYVKLSFERFKLLPGESTKISVCTNPAASLSAITRGTIPSSSPDVGFMWQIKDALYSISFDRNGLLGDLERKIPNKIWTKVAGAFDVDREDRIIAFARPAA